MRRVYSVECTIATAVFAVFSWLDASLGAGLYASITASATHVPVQEGGARGG